MKEPAVSVCIPVYNGEDYIKEAIDSVLAQTFQDYEIVIVDNQSTDRTVQIIQSYRDPRIRFFQNKTNIGLIGNWNESMRRASGKYIKILPADDLIYPHCLSLQVAILENDPGERISLVCGRKRVINEKSESLFTRGFGRRTVEVSGIKAINRTVGSGGNIIGEGAPVMFRRSILEKTGLIDTSIVLATDFSLWFKILLHGNLYFTPDVVGAFRICKSSNSVKTADKQRRESVDFFTQVFNDKRFRLSAWNYRRGIATAFILTAIKKFIYKVLV